MVDIHCHILPAVDDGAKSWDISTEMCQMAIADGVTHMVATPHCNDEYVYDRERLGDMMGELYELAGERLTFSLGCDFHLSHHNIMNALENPARYTIDGTNYLLVEFSDHEITAAVTRHLQEIAVLGIVPILTHPERNKVLLRHPEMVREFVEDGCLVQLTANSLTGFWGSGPQKMAERLLKQNTAHVIASDAHDPLRRTPILSIARSVVAKLMNVEVADALCTLNPSAIVSGQSIPYRPSPR
jgi:protein-tyrosine phosphatase